VEDVVEPVAAVVVGVVAEAVPDGATLVADLDPFLGAGVASDGSDFDREGSRKSLIGWTVVVEEVGRSAPCISGAGHAPPIAGLGKIRCREVFQRQTPFLGDVRQIPEQITDLLADVVDEQLVSVAVA
jgi:hypothetical protein